jgi:hypothetical protein
LAHRPVGTADERKVDAKNKLIVEQAVTNLVVDTGLLTQTPSRPVRFWASKRSTSSPIVATSRNFKIEDIEACEKTGCVPHVAKPESRR